MGKNKEFENNKSVIRTTFTIHAKRQRLTRVDLSQGPNAPIPNEEQVESLLSEIRRRTGKKQNKSAARRRLKI